jgi:hypothetical protein
MSNRASDSHRCQHSLELPAAELLRRARPLPARGEMVIDDLTESEGDAFLAVLAR